MRKCLATGVVFMIAILVQSTVFAQVTGKIYIKKKGQDKTLAGVRAIAGASGIKLYAANNAAITIPYAQIEKVQAPKPANLDQLVALAKRTPAQAIPALTKIMSSYKRMTWDMVAGIALIDALVATKKASQAKTVYTQLKSLYRDKLDSRVHVAYVDVLVGLGDNTKALALLTSLGGGGSPSGAAAAAMKTGDLYADQGKYKDALAHGYFKVIVQYSGVRGAQREAHQKAVKILRDNLRDPRWELIDKRMRNGGR